MDIVVDPELGNCGSDIFDRSLFMVKHLGLFTIKYLFVIIIEKVPIFIIHIQTNLSEFQSLIRDKFYQQKLTVGKATS